MESNKESDAFLPDLNEALHTDMEANAQRELIKKRPRIVVVRSNSIQTQRGRINENIAWKMIDKGVGELTGKDTTSLAWKSLFRSDDVVGVKVNCLGRERFSTHTGVVEGIITGLRSAGIRDRNIIIWDRLTSELRRAGFRINIKGKDVKCFGTDIVGYDEEPEIQGSIGSCFSRILSTLCTALINVPILKDHDLAGVSLGMKNFYGGIHNPNKYHDNNCDPYIADLNSHRFIKDKLRLIVCDGIVGVYNGGPAFKKRWSWNYNGLLIGKDPVALDSLGTKTIEDKRKEQGIGTLKTAGREPKYITSAERSGLGVGDLKKIDAVTLRV